MSARNQRSSRKPAARVSPSAGLTLRPLPSGVIEHRDTPTLGGIVERKDGAFMLAYANHAGLQEGDASVSACRVSSDGGKTWGAPQPLDCGMGIWGMIRLQSGKLAAYGDRRYGEKPVCFSTSLGEMGKGFP